MSAIGLLPALIPRNGKWSLCSRFTNYIYKMSEK